MLTRLLAVGLVLAGCASAPAVPREPVVEELPGEARAVRILVGKEDAFRLSRAGVMDPSSPSGLTDRFRYRQAVEAYAAQALARRGLCPRGFAILEVAPARTPFDIAITVDCLPP